MRASCPLVSCIWLTLGARRGIPAYAISFTASSSQLTNTTTLQGGYSSQLYNTKTSKTPQGDPEVDVGAEAGIDACGNASGAGGYSGQWGMKELIAQGVNVDVEDKIAELD